MTVYRMTKKNSNSLDLWQTLSDCQAVGVSFEKSTNIYGAFYDGTVALKFLRRSPPEIGG